MKTLTKFVSAAAVALSLTVAAVPAQAMVFAQFSPLTNANDYVWTNSGPGNTGTGGTFTASGSVAFSFLDPALSAIQFALPTTFTSSMTVTPGHPATLAVGPGTWTQTGLNGSFSFIYNGPSQFYGTIFVANGSNLLSGTVTESWIQGAGGTGSNNVTIGNGGSLTYTSDFETFANSIPGKNEFAFNLLGGNIVADPGAALRSFGANGGGNFSFQTVPEPGTWALMIMGFGGVGVLLRNRRRQGVAFA
ncbi:MAG: hypothetical protein JWQ29_851 [Phenylobacterium sp.]|nr:hypothetical protein [Phenylobacterium sp.]